MVMSAQRLQTGEVAERLGRRGTDRPPLGKTRELPVVRLGQTTIRFDESG